MEVLQALAGGALIGAAATLLLWSEDRAACVSGAVTGLLARRPDLRWRAAFVGGIICAGALASASGAAVFAPLPPRSVGALAAAGFLVGVGARLAGGCTSGHGVCGLSRLSARSFAAVLAFLASGGVMAFLARTLAGGRL